MRRPAKKPADEPVATHTMTERVDITDCLDLLRGDREWSRNTISQLVNYLTHNGVTQVNYFHAKDTDSGRLFASGLQSIEKGARAYLCRNRYREIDFRNCAPRIMMSMCTATQKLSDGYKQLEAYCDNSAHYQQEIPKIKELLYRALFSGQSPVGDHQLITAFLEPIHKLARALEQDPSTFSRLVQRRESENLEELIEFLGKFGIHAVARIFDGVMVDCHPRLGYALQEWADKCPEFPVTIKDFEVPELNLLPIDRWDFDDPCTFQSEVVPKLGQVFDSKLEAFYTLRIPMLKTFRSFNAQTVLIKGRDRKVYWLKHFVHVVRINVMGSPMDVSLMSVTGLVPQFFRVPVISYSRLGEGFSLYPGFVAKPQNGDCSLILNHIREVWSAGIDKIGDFVLDWLAFIVQKHPRQTGSILLINGDEGTGKSCLFNFIQRRIFGRLALTMTGCDKLTRNFNSHLVGKILICLEELKGDNENSYKHDLNRIKYLVDSPDLDIEKKGVDVFTEENSINIIAFSNYDAPLPMVTGINRRLVQIRSSRCRQKDQVYFKTLNDYLENDPDAPGNFLGFLMNRVVDENRLRHDKPVTSEKILGQWNCLHDVDKAVYLILRQHPKGIAMTAHDTLTTIKKIRQNTQQTTIGVGRRLTSLGFVKKQVGGVAKYHIKREDFNFNPDMEIMCEEFASEELEPMSHGLNLFDLLMKSAKK